MVEWTDAERNAIKAVWRKINVDVASGVGKVSVSVNLDAICWLLFYLHVFLHRSLIVYPWTQSYFGSFGSLSDAASIMGSKKVAAHGKVVVNGLGRAVQNMDDIKNTYAPLSVLHSEKLHVDPDNFRVGHRFWVWIWVWERGGVK